MAKYFDASGRLITQSEMDEMPEHSVVYTEDDRKRLVGGFYGYGGHDAWKPSTVAEFESGMPVLDHLGRVNDPSAQLPLGIDETGVPQYSDPIGYRGHNLNNASVVQSPKYQRAYNPAGAYAEAGRTVPNRANEWAMAMNQVSQPQGGVPSDLHNWGANIATDPLSFASTSMVPRPRIPTAQEQVKRAVSLPDEKAEAFGRIHDAYFTGADFGYEEGWPERLNVPQEYIDMYMAVPDRAKKYAYENPTDAVLEQFEEKYGFPLDMRVNIQELEFGKAAKPSLTGPR